MKQFIATVVSNDETPPVFSHPRAHVLGVRLVRLKCPEMPREVRPGQFVMVRCGDECVLPRPFSVHQARHGDIAILFVVLGQGKGTTWLSRRQAGDKVELLGFLGNGFSIEPKSERLLLVAGGMGIAPLYFLAEEALARGRKVTLLYGTVNASRHPERLFPSKLELVAATEDGSVGHKGRATDLLSRYAPKADQVFACGPLPMYRDMATRKRELGLEGKPVQISLEMRMGCGIGVCYSCTVKTRSGLKQVCKDGPVFDLDDVLWDSLPDYVT